MSVELDKREAQIVVKLGLIRTQLRRALEQRQRLDQASTLVGDDAKIMQGEWIIGRLGERSAIFALGSVDLSAAMRGQCPLREVIRR